MPYISPEVIEQARQIDLLTYLRRFEPDNVEEVKGTRNVYRTVDHDSLKMSNGKWFWWSQGFGGYNALDYLIKVRNYSFMDAVEILTGKELANWTPPPKKEEKNEPKVLRLPEKYQDSKRVIQYLFNRGIDYQIIQECIADGVIFESNGRYHNAVFVGKDETGTPKYAAYRGLGSSTFKGDACGSFPLSATTSISLRHRRTHSALSMHRNFRRKPSAGISFRRMWSDSFSVPKRVR